MMRDNNLKTGLFGDHVCNHYLKAVDGPAGWTTNAIPVGGSQLIGVMQGLDVDLARERDKVETIYSLIKLIVA